MSRTVWFAPGSTRRLIALLMLAAVVFAAALLIGTSGISLRGALAALTGSGDETARAVMLEVRLPRLLAAFGVGGLLAVAGVLLQALFRNPLADPYVLGVSGGAAIGALLAMMAGATAIFVQSGAVLGALGAVAIVVCARSRRRHGQTAAHRSRHGERIRRAHQRAALGGGVVASPEHGVLAGGRPRMGA